MTKEKFISEQIDSRKAKFKTMFQRVKLYEQKNGTDLGEFSTKQLEEFIVNEYDLCTVRRVHEIQILIRRYVTECRYDASAVNGINAQALYENQNENILLYKNVNELLDEMAICEQFAEDYMDFNHPDPDWLLRIKVAVILAWRGLGTVEMVELTWHDIEGTVNNYTAVNGRNITTAESEILSKWFLKRTRRRNRGEYVYPDTPLVMKSTASVSSIQSKLLKEIKELNEIEQWMPSTKKYKFDFRNIKLNGNFAYALEHGEEVLGIHRPLSPEDSRILRMFNLYKEKMK